MMDKSSTFFMLTWLSFFFAMYFALSLQLHFVIVAHETTLTMVSLQPLMVTITITVVVTLIIVIVLSILSVGSLCGETMRMGNFQSLIKPSRLYLHFYSMESTQ